MGSGKTRHNLPAPLTSFVGRDRHLDRIVQMLDGQRLVTLVGPGGVGKTRLALAAGAVVAGRGGRDVRLVELGALAVPGAPGGHQAAGSPTAGSPDQALVPWAVADALGLSVDHRRKSPAEALAAALEARELLLILDNCEHVLEACAQVVERLLRSCPDVRVLATSREAVGVPGEMVWRVPPLSVPYPDRDGRPELLLRSDAARLFVERAAAVCSDFALTELNAPAVAEICYRLDGLPLAIELAAARTGVLAVEQIAARLSDRFALLTAGARTALPRQQTLRGTLDWSYELLTPDGRALLRRLAVFAGGFSLEAAEAVGADAETGEGAAVLDALADLVEKSLVVADVGARGRARYRLMETVRAYALERLCASGDEPDARRRHAGHFLGVAEQAALLLQGPEQLLWLERLDEERENLRAAFDASLAAGEPDWAPRIVAALGWLWYLRGSHREGRAWWERLPADRRVPAAIRARAAIEVGFLADAQFDLGPARGLLEAGLTLARQSGDRRLIGAALARLGYLTMHESRLDAAADLMREALAHHRAADDRWGEAFDLMALGHVQLHRGDPAGAAPLSSESLELFRRLGDRWGIARALHGVGQVAFDRGDYEGAEAAWCERVDLSRQLGAGTALAHGLDLVGTAARLRGDWSRAAACYEESLPLRRSTSDRRGTAWTLHYLGLTACQAGDPARSRELLTESLAIRREVGEVGWIGLALEGFATLAALEGRARTAIRLAAAATALRAVAWQPRTPVEEGDLRPWLDRARAQLGATAADLWREGEALGLEGAVDLALSPEAESAGAATPRARENGYALTAREREVAALIARGLSNRQIAEQLVIAPGTAGVHVAHVLGKLGLHTRAQVAAWAVEQGISRQPTAISPQSAPPEGGG